MIDKLISRFTVNASLMVFLAACFATTNIDHLINDEAGLTFITDGSVYYFGPPLLEDPSITLHNPTGVVIVIDEQCRKFGDLVFSYSDDERSVCDSIDFYRKEEGDSVSYTAHCHADTASHLCPPNLRDPRIYRYFLNSDNRFQALILDPETSFPVVLQNRALEADIPPALR